MKSPWYSLAVAAASRLFHRLPGRDVLVCGYDHYHDVLVERDLEPSLPALTVDKRNDLMGTELVNLLLDRVVGKLPQPPVTRPPPRSRRPGAGVMQLRGSRTYS